MIQKYIERYPDDAEVVEAVQFKDNEEVLVALSHWFGENGIETVRVSYEDIMNTRLILEHGRGNFAALVGWYIVKDPQGNFCAYEESAFHNAFILHTV